MTREQETQLFEAVIAVSRITAALAMTKPELRHFTDRHRAMLHDAGENFGHASALLIDLAAVVDSREAYRQK